LTLPTPPRLRRRAFATTDYLPPPDGRRFRSTIQRVPQQVLRRSTYRPACPVDVAGLRYVTMTFWGFDHRPHTGEMILAASEAREVTTVFRHLYRERFPIEEMRVSSRRDLRAPPTGDGNNTSAFSCRFATQGASWSQHAYGLAVDVDPFQNPYRSGHLVLPELASSYTNRSWRRPGMILAGGMVVRAFAAIGWGWGGSWHTVKDYMHFSSTGR
jgi:hypothetical protein